MSDFHVNHTINSKATVVKVTLLLHLCTKWTKRGRTDTNDAERSGKPNEAVTPENIKQVLKIVMDDRKLKVREIAKMVNISSGSASTMAKLSELG